MLFRTPVQDSGWYKSLVCSSLTNLSPKCGVVIVRRGQLLSPLRVVNMCFPVSWMSAGQQLERMRNGTSPFLVWYSQNCSLAVTELCRWVSLGCDVWLATSISCLFLKSWVVWLVFSAGTLWVFSNLWWLVDLSESCCQPTSENGRNFVVLAVFTLSNAPPDSKRSVSS